MTQFLLLNCKDFILHQDTQLIQAQAQYCFCCLAINTQLISLTYCKHSSYLDIFDINQLEQSKRVVCYECHSMLETIETFRQQVITAREKLTNQTIFDSVIYQKPQILDIDVPPLSAITKIKREVYGSELPKQSNCMVTKEDVCDDNQIFILPHVKNEPVDTELSPVGTEGPITGIHGVTSHIIIKTDDVDTTQESLAHAVKVEIDQEPTSTVRVNKGALRKERDRRYYDKHQERINQRRRDNRQNRQCSQNAESLQPTRQNTSSNKAEKKTLRKERDRKYRERHRDEINKRRKERRHRQNIQNAASNSEEISDEQHREDCSNYLRYYTEF